MTSSTVLVHRDQGVGLITLNRPEVLNAMNQQLLRELAEAVGELAQDAAVKVLVLTGAGRAFCAGADIHEMVGQGQAEASPGQRSHLEALASCKKPVVAALNGLAFGGGSMLASVADIRFGCEHSRFRFPTAFGRVGGTWSLALIVGMSKAKEILFSGRIVEAEEAAAIGLLDRLVPSGRLMEESMQFARTVAARPPEMVQAVKQLLHDYVGMPFQAMPGREREVARRVVVPPYREAFKDFFKGG